MDPTVPVPRWSLRPEGRARIDALVDGPPAWFAEVTALVTSDETKALEAAAPLGLALGLEPSVIAETGEIDRSSTGFVAEERHEDLRTRLFDQPDVSADGWERAIDAQRRVVGAIAPFWPPSDPGSATGLLLVGHGAVGTMLWCHLTGAGIDLRHDQPGQGHLWCVDLGDPGRSHPWRRF